MSTTSLRLSDDLKQQVAQLAEQAGKTPHTFMVEAIAEKVSQEALRQDFQAEANARLERMLKGGRAVSWDDMKDYLHKRAQGVEVKKPKARKLAR